MTIEYAILGLLSCRSMTGYEIKKTFADSVVLYWSDNNNQIYTTLVSLHKDELVTREIQYQEDRPARKIYSITENGSLALKKWVLSPPELPQLKHTFLVQLAWADQLTTEEMDALLCKYEEDTHMQLLMCQAIGKTEKTSLEDRRHMSFLHSDSARTRREAFIWRSIQDHWNAFYENELTWVQKLRTELLNNWRNPLQ